MQREVDLNERLKDALDHGRRDSLARVANTKDSLAVFQNSGKPDSAHRLGILGGIVQEIGQHLLQTSCIALHPHRFSCHRYGQLVATSLDEGSAGLDRSLHQFGKIEYLLSQ